MTTNCHKARRLCLAAVLMPMLIATSFTEAPAQTSTPESVIRSFYKWYIGAIDGGADPLKEGKTILRRYVSLRLIRQIVRDEANGLDADEFLQTQEWDKAWADNVRVSKLAVKGEAATAIVTFNREEYPRVLVTLVKDAGVWKLDKVKNAKQ